MLTTKQQGVLRGMVAGSVVTLLVLVAAVLFPPATLLPEPGLAALAHALRWDVLVVACLMGNVGALARHRFVTPEDIDGGGLTTGTPRAKILQSTVQNTLEQAVLALSAHAIWAATMPHAWQAAVPAAALLFLAGRVLFWRGYALGAPSRALGFALTFYPSVALVLAVGGRLALAPVL